MTKSLEAENYAAHFAGARLTVQKTTAVEAKYYGRGGDPANHIEFPSEVERRRKIKEARQIKKSQYRKKGK